MPRVRVTLARGSWLQPVCLTSRYSSGERLQSVPSAKHRLMLSGAAQTGRAGGGRMRKSWRSEVRGGDCGHGEVRRYIFSGLFRNHQTLI